MCLSRVCCASSKRAWLWQVAAPWERPFEARFIKNMELVVLARLKWHVTAITAASFIDRLLYVAARCTSLLKDNGLLHRMRTRAGLLVTRCLPGKQKPAL